MQNHTSRFTKKFFTEDKINSVKKPTIDKIIIAFTFQDMHSGYIPNREGIHIERINVDDPKLKKFFTSSKANGQTTYRFNEEKTKEFKEKILTEIEEQPVDKVFRVLKKFNFYLMVMAIHTLQQLIMKKRSSIS